AGRLAAAGIPILGTAPADLDVAEDRQKFGALLDELGIPTPAHGVAASLPEARLLAGRIGFPVLVRPSYVLGGRAMQIVYGEDELDGFMTKAAAASPSHPVFVDRFLESAVEVDVDAVCDGREVLIGAVMEHIEEAGVHSGDSTCVVPPVTLSDAELDRIEEIVRTIAGALRVRGLLNVQLAVRDEVPFVLEANPRASRTVPFVSKATGVPLAKLAARVVRGSTLDELREEGVLPARGTGYRELPHVRVKAAVLPFGREPRTDGYFIRTAAAKVVIPCITTLPGLLAAVQGIEALRGASGMARSLQEYHAAVTRALAVPAGSAQTSAPMAEERA